MTKMEKIAAPVAIAPLNMQRATLQIVGTAPYMQARFSEKQKALMRAKHEAGSTARKGSAKAARDFEEDYRQAMHTDLEGRAGIPAGAFRAACISACRLVGFKMTLAKLSVFIEADTLDAAEGTPLVFIHGEPEMSVMHTRNATGVADLRARPMWREWSADLRIKWDAGQFTLSDVVNLVDRAGNQVGIGEGRPDSRSSAGLGFGTFEVKRGAA
jgi:hypothetical protein